MTAADVETRAQPANFFRFAELKAIVSNPHLSTGKGGIVEGRYINMRSNNKEAGTGSEFHYHPNELLIFVIKGKLNALVGKDRRIVAPGMFIHVPAFAGHQMRATEDGPVNYLYVKDRTWSMVGVAADEEPPEEAPTIEAIAEVFESGQWPGQEKAPEKSKIIVDGLGDCFYPMADLSQRDFRVADRLVRMFGERMAFSFFECSGPSPVPDVAAETEQFIYVADGSLDISTADAGRSMRAGDVVHLPRDSEHGMRAGEGGCRIGIFNALPSLQSRIDESSE